MEALDRSVFVTRFYARRRRQGSFNRTFRFRCLSLLRLRTPDLSCERDKSGGDKRQPDQCGSCSRRVHPTTPSLVAPVRYAVIIAALIEVGLKLEGTPGWMATRR